MAGRPAISGSHGEVETVTSSLPRPFFHGSGIADCTLNFGPGNDPATLSVRIIVGGSTGSVSSTESAKLGFDWDSASKRILTGNNPLSATLALNRNTTGTFRPAVCVDSPATVTLQFASVTHCA